MLYVRHTVGSRLLYETTEYEILSVDNGWKISFRSDKESAASLLKFHDELNIFHVEGNLKTWYYSSEGNVNVVEKENKVLISADHKTVYPV